MDITIVWHNSFTVDWFHLTVAILLLVSTLVLVGIWRRLGKILQYFKTHWG